MAHPIERKLAAILSADVVGYSRLIAEDEALRRHVGPAPRRSIRAPVPPR